MQQPYLSTNPTQAKESIKKRDYVYQGPKPDLYFLEDRIERIGKIERIWEGSVRMRENIREKDRETDRR